CSPRCAHAPRAPRRCASAPPWRTTRAASRFTRSSAPTASSTCSSASSSPVSAKNSYPLIDGRLISDLRFRLAPAEVEPEGRVDVCHKAGIDDHPQRPPVQADDEFEYLRPVRAGEGERDGGEQRQHADQAEARDAGEPVAAQ